MGRKITRIDGVQTCIWLSRETLDKLDALVKERGSNRRAVIEQAIAAADQTSQERRIIERIQNYLAGDIWGDAPPETPEKNG